MIDHGRVVHDGSIEALHSRYGSRRRLVADLDSPLPPGFAVEGATLVSVEADGHRASFDLLTDAAGPVVARLAALSSLRDLSLVEPDIEDVVARLYGDVSVAP